MVGMDGHEISGNGVNEPPPLNESDSEQIEEAKPVEEETRTQSAEKENDEISEQHERQPDNRDVAANDTVDDVDGNTPSVAPEVVANEEKVSKEIDQHVEA